MAAIFLAGPASYASGDNESNGNRCGSNSDCRDGFRCEADGKCRKDVEPCNRNCGNEECGDGEICWHGKCKKDNARDDNKLCSADVQCDDDQICWGGKCVKDTPRDDKVCTNSGRCASDETCDNGRCHQHTTCDRICATDAQCEDGDVCRNGKCHKRTPGGECSTDAQCAADQVCDKGKCKKNNPGHDHCTTDAECDPGEVCRNGKCHKETPADHDCTVDAECDADEVCRNGKCHKRTPADDCRTDADCAPGQVCRDGRCHGDNPTDGCSSHADCLPGQWCVDHQCQAGPEPCTPTPELCSDGNDNDCDGLIDAADPDCRSAAAVEVCGDCADNDGNGLTDFEDPACCGSGASFVMDLSHGRIVPKGATSKLRISTKLAGAAAAINPLAQDVYLQIRPANGRDILCAKAPASKFMRQGKAFKFWAGKTPVPSTQGIHDMKIKIRRDGSVVYKAFGKRVRMSKVQHGALQLTVGFKNVRNGRTTCSAAVAGFQATKGQALIAR